MGEQTWGESGPVVSTVVADPSWLMRTAIRGVLEGGGLRVVGEAEDVSTAVALSGEHQPVLVVMGEGLFGQSADPDSGPVVCRAVLGEASRAQILVLAREMDVDEAGALASAGVTGYILRDVGPDTLLTAARAVAEGEYRLPAPLIRRLVGLVKCMGQKPGQQSALTPRETQILTLFASGSSYAQVGESLGVRPLTVRNTIYRIRGKLGLETTHGVVLWALLNGLLDLDGEVC